MKGRKMKKGIVLVLVLFACFLSAADAKEGVRWNLKFEQVELDRISIKTGTQLQSYWYLIYKVSNETDETVPLRLSIKAISDVANKTYLEGYYKKVEGVVERIKGRKLLNIRDMRSEIGPGKTLEAIAVFGSIAESTDTCKIQVLGLWDRVRREGTKLFVEDRALVLKFKRPGDEYFPQHDMIVFDRFDWVVLYSREVTK